MQVLNNQINFTEACTTSTSTKITDTADKQLDPLSLSRRSCNNKLIATVIATPGLGA